MSRKEANARRNAAASARAQRLSGPGERRTEAEVELRRSIAQMQAQADELLDHITEARAALWGGDADGVFDNLGLAQATYAELGEQVVWTQAA